MYFKLRGRVDIKLDLKRWLLCDTLFDAPLCGHSKVSCCYYISLCT